MAAANERSGTI